MKTLIAAVVCTGFFSAPALACSFGKTAGHKMPATTASADMAKTEEAMSTFDPQKLPAFEETKEAAAQPSVKEGDKEPAAE